MNWKAWVGIIISFIFLYIVFHDADFSNIATTLSQANYIYLLVSLVIGLFAYVLRAFRWKFLLKPTKDIPFSSLFTATVIGFMANNILPVRIGEFVRVYVIAKDEKVSMSSALATLVVERIFDGFTLIIFLLISSSATPVPNWVSKISYLATILFAAILFFVLALVAKPDWNRKFFMFLSKKFPMSFQKRLAELLESFIQGLGMLRSVKLVLIVIVLSFVHWLFIGFSFQIALEGFDIEIPALGPYFVLSVVALGVAIPSSPGFVGTFQFFTQKGLAVYNVSSNIALSFAIAYHVINYIPVTALGLILFWKKNISWSELKHSEEEIEESLV